MATLKQKKAFKISMENNGNVSAAMREVGYGTTSENPHLLTNSKGWKELMEEYISDDLVAMKHNELLNKTDDKGEVDTMAVSKALDMAYKLKGSYAAEKTTSLNVNVDVKKTDRTELDALREEYIEKLKQKLVNGTQ